MLWFFVVLSEFFLLVIFYFNILVLFKFCIESKGLKIVSYGANLFIISGFFKVNHSVGFTGKGFLENKKKNIFNFLFYPV